MRTIGYLAVGAGVLLLPWYFKRNGFWGAALLGITLLDVWQRIPPKTARA